MPDPPAANPEAVPVRPSVPGLSVAPDEDDRTARGGHHAPNFYVNERALGVGLKAMLHSTLDSMVAATAPAAGGRRREKGR